MKLQPLKKEHYGYEPFLVADIEAPGWVNFLVIGITDGTNFEYFSRLQDFFRSLIKLPHSTIYFHYGGKFDFLHLLDYLLSSTTWNVVEIIPRGVSMLSLKVRHADGKEFTFRDSSALLPFSLARLTETFATKHRKLKFENYENMVLDAETLRYLEHDCKGLHESITAYFDWPLVTQSGPAPTVASQAMRILRLFINEEFVGLGKHVDAFVRKGYIAGRTEIFRPVAPEGLKLHCYDVNSLFPYCMAQDVPGNFRYWTREYEPGEMGFYRARVRVPDDQIVPILGKKMLTKDGTEKLVFPIGEFSGTWSSAELDYAKELGCEILEIQSGAIFQNRGKVFAPYINELYEMKRRATPGTPHYELSKLIINSSYGRLGIRRDKEKLIFDDGREGFQEIREFEIRGKKVCLGRVPTEYNGFSNVAIAAWITALARIHMHRLMRKIDFDVWYTDTDSLFTPRELPTGELLGELKLEDTTTEGAVFLLPKTYAFGKKIRMKGIDRKAAAAFTFKDFYQALEGERKLEVAVPSKFATLRSAIRSGKLVTMLPPSKKTVKAVYSKRVIYQNSDGWFSRPIKLKTIGKKEHEHGNAQNDELGNENIRDKGRPPVPVSKSNRPVPRGKRKNRSIDDRPVAGT